MYHNFFICSCVHEDLGCFHVLAFVYSAAMNTGVHVACRIGVFSVYVPSSGVAGSLADLLLCAVLCLVTWLCPALCNPVDCSLLGSSVHGDFPSKNTRVGSLSLLQGNFLTQESNWGLLHCRQILYQLSYQESPRFIPSINTRNFYSYDAKS